MDTNERYVAFLRSRISELLAQRGISEHKLSLGQRRFLHPRYHQWANLAIGQGIIQYHRLF